MPDKKAKPLEGGTQMVVPINIVCAPAPIPNEIKTVCFHYLTTIYLFSCLIRTLVFLGY